jgi:preprotein translocase subunit YajC
MFADIAYAMGPAPQQAGQAGGPAAMFTSMLPLVLIFVIFYFLLIRPQQKKAKEQRAMLDNLKKGDKIVLSGGEYGVIDEVKGNTIVVKIAENVKVKYGKAYVAGLRQSDDD